MNIDAPRPGMLPQLKALWKEAFGDPEAFIDLFFTTAYAPGRCLCLWQGQQVLAAAYWLDCACSGGKLAYIYAVATKKEARGRGLCHKLLGAIHEKLQEQGYAGAVLVPGAPELAKLYSHMGYAFFGGMDVLSAKSGEASEAFRSLQPMEYARLRRGLLPEGGIRQEAEGLRFLAGYARFAAGEDWLLAYTQENGAVFGIEWLGDPRKLPAVLAALGADSGRFRTPGTGAFAMHKPLSDGRTPTYLGFAFD